MKSLKLSVSAFAVALALGGASAHAFELPKVPSLGGSSGGASTASAAEVMKNTRNSLYAFTKAEVGLAGALGGYTELAAQKELLNNLKAGDAAAKKDDLQTLVTIHESASKEINAKVAANDKLDVSQKSLAAQSMVEYVKGLISSKKTVSSLQDLAKNPVSLGLEANTVLYAAKEVPSIVAGGASSTTTLVKYLTSNGVDTSEAKNLASDLGK
ncbi:hypothetical protein [Ralstonia pickettii]|uniref:hypothetical protein n=1 Tax=Ralstonia pickettii TaxID=329 RepID=UPI000469B8F1|nr:hypothetical protein [Ralstonia pickettii]